MLPGSGTTNSEPMFVPETPTWLNFTSTWAASRSVGPEANSAPQTTMLPTTTSRAIHRRVTPLDATRFTTPFEFDDISVPRALGAIRQSCRRRETEDVPDHQPTGGRRRRYRSLARPRLRAGPVGQDLLSLPAGHRRGDRPRPGRARRRVPRAARAPNRHDPLLAGRDRPQSIPGLRLFQHNKNWRHKRYRTSPGSSFPGGGSVHHTAV